MTNFDVMIMIGSELFGVAAGLVLCWYVIIPWSWRRHDRKRDRG